MNNYTGRPFYVRVTEIYEVLPVPFIELSVFGTATVQYVKFWLN